MVIQYLGEECVRLQSGEVSLLVNPSSNRLKADVTLKTIAAPEARPEEGEFIFPGEYEMKGMQITGWQIEDESTASFIKTVFAVEWEEMKFVFLGHLSGIPKAEWVENCANADILFLPTGDPHFISSPDAAKLVKQLEPAIIIPTFRKSPADFLKAMGAKGETMEKLVIKKKDLADKKSQVVTLEVK